MSPTKENSGLHTFKDADDWEDLKGIDGAPLKSSTLYRVRLTPSIPRELIASPKSSYPARTKRGQNILDGVWRFGTSQLKVPKERAPWGPPFPTLHFSDRIHRFEWLRDLLANDDAGAKLARSLTVSWVNAFGKWDDMAWRVDVTADRIINWLIGAPQVITPLAGDIRANMLECLTRQVHHVYLSHEDLKSMRGKRRAAVSLTLAGLCIPDGDLYLDKGMALLETVVEQQLLQDGGHITRSPSQLAEMLIDLNIVEDLLLRMSREAPSFLSKAQMRMQNMLKFLRLPDGGCIVANSSSDGWDGLVQAALSPFGEGGGKFAFAQQTGFHRVTAGDLSLYLDIGSSQTGKNTEIASASCLSLHITDGHQRLITSMGVHDDLDPVWRHASRQTAASSTLQMANGNSANFHKNEETRLYEISGPRDASARRLEEGDQLLLEAQHSGWREEFGLVFRRRVYIAKNGDRVTGEDAIYRPLSELKPAPENAIPYKIRFQLHPSIAVEGLDEGQTLLLKCPNSDFVWRFKSDLPVRVETGVYAAGGARRAAAQLVISGKADPEGDGSSLPNRLRWALIRLSRKHVPPLPITST